MIYNPKNSEKFDKKRCMDIFIFLNYSYWLSKFGSYVRSDDVLMDIGQFKKSLIAQSPQNEKKIKQLIGRSAM